MDTSRDFVSTVRTEENFIRNNADPSIVFPSPYVTEYEPEFQDNIILPITGFLRSGSQWFSAARFSILFGSIGWGFVCSAISTVFYLAVEYEKKCSNFLGDEEAVQNWVSSVGDACQWILSDYRFFPIFLIVGYIGFVVQRWREWMINCHSIQGRLHDIAMLIGGCVGPNPDKVVRKKLFKIYRYLNLIHALCYMHASPTLAGLDLETDFVHKLGLLTVDEAYALLAIEVKQRENVLSWLSAEVVLLLQMDSVNGNHVGLELFNSIRGLRGSCATHHDLFVRDNPNLYLSLMMLVVNLMLFLVILSYPFALMVPTPPFFPFIPGAQPLVGIGVGVLTFTLRCAYALLVRLRNPFSWTVDQIRVDSLMASSDRAIFTHLRAMFDAETTSPDEYGEAKQQVPSKPSAQTNNARASIINLASVRNLGHRQRSAMVIKASQKQLSNEILVPVDEVREF